MSVHVGFIGRNGVAMLQRGDADVGAAVLRHVTRGDCEVLRLGESVLRRVADSVIIGVDRGEYVTLFSSFVIARLIIDQIDLYLVWS